MFDGIESIPNWDAIGLHVHPDMAERAKCLLADGSAEDNAVAPAMEVFVHHELCDSTTWWVVRPSASSDAHIVYTPSDVEIATEMLQWVPLAFNLDDFQRMKQQRAWADELAHSIWQGDMEIGSFTK